MKTKIEIYHALVRSIMEYASFIYDLLPKNAKSKIDTIHHTALRIITNKNKLVEGRLINNKRILEQTNELSMEARLNNLKNRYLHKAIINDNPLIKPLVNEFINFKGGRQLNTRTILCSVDYNALGRPTYRTDQHRALSP